MYSATIKSDGMLHRPAAPKPAPTPSRPPAKDPSPALRGDTLLILAIAVLLLQNKQPDWLLLAARVYLLLG